jgi:ubiquinone/menaquinone biosynthesis C-methylase UbiE
MSHLQKEWDAQYASGVWDYLAALEQRPRSAVIASWILARQVPPRILDIGCGEGHLIDHFAPGLIQSYVGIDFSKVAIARARTKWATRECEFLEADAASVPLRCFDGVNAVVFNEILYCLKDPAEALSRALGSGADVFVSITSLHPETSRLAYRLFNREVVEWVTCFDERRNKGWTIGMLRSNNYANT